MMEFLHPESRFMDLLNKITDLMLLNVIFIVTSIPILTLGASLTALYSVTLKLSREEDVYLVREYFASFRSSFRKATLLWGILFTAGVILAAETALLFLSDFQLRSVFLMIQGGLILFYLITLMVTFPLLSESSRGVKEILKTAVNVPFASFPEAMGILAIHGIPVAVTGLAFLVFPQVFLLWGFIGFSYVAYLASFLLNRVSLRMKSDNP